MSRHQLPTLSNSKIVERYENKKKLLLEFLSWGEHWTSMRIASHLWRIEERQTQSTLNKMVEKKLLAREKISHLNVYGITTTGLALINGPDNGKAFSKGKTPESTIRHHLLSQKVRLKLEGQGAEDWAPGKMLYGKLQFNRIPDGLCLLDDKITAIEIELTVKSDQRMKGILHTYFRALGHLDDPFAYVHQVIYFTPYTKALTKFITLNVPTELRCRFKVEYLDIDIKSYKRGSD
jgi:hypothetical protein